MILNVLLFFSILFFISLFLFIIFIIHDIIFDVFYKIKKIPTVPFISSPSHALPFIYKALKLKKKSVLYDLGCGDGKVLKFLSNTFPKAEYIGVEKNLFPFFLGFFKKTISRKKFLILHKDFFNLDFNDATHIFIYLHPDILASLSSFLDKKLSSGTRLVSLDYPLFGRHFDKVVKLKNNNSELGKRLYIYNF